MPKPFAPWAAAFATAFFLAGCALQTTAPDARSAAGRSGPAAAGTDNPAAPPPALRLEGVPPIAHSLLQATRRYNGVAGHGFVDWHPTQREMLLTHRAPGASTAQLYRLRNPLGVPERLTDGADPVTQAQWEPRSGRYIVFARGSGGDEAFQLYRLDPDTGATVQITPSGQRHALQGWLKSRALAVVTSVPLDRTAEGGRRGNISTALTLLDPLNPTSARVLADLPGGGWFGAEVSPDEKQIAITHYVSAAESEVWLIDIASGQSRRLLPAAGEPTWASHLVQAWTSDGRGLFVVSNRASEFLEMMRVDLASSTLTRLGPPTAWDAASGSVSADGRHLAFVLNVDGRDELRVIDPASGAARTLPRLPGGSASRSSFHPARNEVAFVVNSAQGPAQIYSVEVPAGAGQGPGTLVPWTQPLGTENLALQNLPDQQIVRWQSFDGRTISGVLSLPPARFAGRRPVVMLMHGGPESQAKQGWQGRWNYLTEQLGVAVLEPNVRGSSGYGKTFLALDNGRLREDSVKDMASAIDWLATQPRLDAGRVLVAGGSYGGYMALAAATKLADRIAGASSSVGISNFVTFLENTETYRRDLRRAEYGDERDLDMRNFLQSISPLTHAANITKPLMVVQGRNDPRVPWTESEQIVRTLQARGTPVWYLLADNEGHGFARRENAEFQFAAFVQFVQATLKP